MSKFYVYISQDKDKEIYDFISGLRRNERNKHIKALLSGFMDSVNNDINTKHSDLYIDLARHGQYSFDRFLLGREIIREPSPVSNPVKNEMNQAEKTARPIKKKPVNKKTAIFSKSKGLYLFFIIQIIF